MVLRLKRKMMPFSNNIIDLELAENEAAEELATEQEAKSFLAYYKQDESLTPRRLSRMTWLLKAYTDSEAMKGFKYLQEFEFFMEHHDIEILTQLKEYHDLLKRINKNPLLRLLVAPRRSL